MPTSVQWEGTYEDYEQRVLVLAAFIDEKIAEFCNERDTTAMMVMVGLALVGERVGAWSAEECAVPSELGHAAWQAAFETARIAAPDFLDTDRRKMN